MGMSEFGPKSKRARGGRGVFLFLTVEPGYNETRYNKVLGILKDIVCPSYSVMYGKEPRYNKTSF